MIKERKKKVVRKLVITMPSSMVKALFVALVKRIVRLVDTHYAKINVLSFLFLSIWVKKSIAFEHRC